MIVILIDNGHGEDTKGKCSPDKRLKEWSWTRSIAKAVKERLCALGYDARLVTPEDMDVSLSERCRRINTICRQFGTQNCLSVSIHANAAGADGNWHNASGWSVYVSPNASMNSKRLAKLLYNEAEKRNLKGNRSVPVERYWVQNLAMCRDTNCPAVLTENLFMDNIGDCNLMLSQKGREAIVDLHVQGIINYINTK